MSSLESDLETRVENDSTAKRQGHRRVSARIPIRISTIDPEKDPKTGKLFFFTSDEFSSDLSRGGAFVVTPELIEPGKNGWLVPAGSLEALIEAMREAISLPNEEIAEMGRMGRESALRLHDTRVEVAKRQPVGRTI